MSDGKEPRQYWTCTECKVSFLNFKSVEAHLKQTRHEGYSANFATNSPVKWYDSLEDVIKDFF